MEEEKKYLVGPPLYFSIFISIIFGIYSFTIALFNNNKDGRYDISRMIENYQYVFFITILLILIQTVVIEITRYQTKKFIEDKEREVLKLKYDHDINTKRIQIKELQHELSKLEEDLKNKKAS